MDTCGRLHRHLVELRPGGQRANGHGYGVYARRYDSFGYPLAAEFQVNVTTAGNQQDSTVSLADNGIFVIAWESSQDGVNNDIVARVFDADGTPLLAAVAAATASSPLTSEVPVLVDPTAQHR